MEKMRFIHHIVALILTSSTFTSFSVSAQTMPADIITADETPNIELSPINLVFLAHRGYLKEQGIPSYASLMSAYIMGEVSAADIVQAAVESGRLSDEYLSNQQYMRATEAQLETLENIH